MADLAVYRVPLTMGHQFDRGPGWHTLRLRPGTDDEAILDEIMVQDTYRLRGVDLSPIVISAVDDVTAGQTVVDLGANVGIFTATCIQKGAGKVIAVEPELANFDLLVENVAKWPDRVETIRAAVGATRGRVSVLGGTGTAHTSDEGDDVPQITLEAILGTVERCSLLKLDVEGAEHAIITACPHSALAKVDQIVMELHGPAVCPWMDAPRWGEIVEHLSETHAVSLFGRPSEGGGHLFAHRYPR